jgi:hypothetical protein
MNYQEIVNRIQDITDQHKMLADFGYGDLSDLKVRFENTSGNEQVQADYPYLFLNPGVHQRNQGMVTYNFNMIVMDMARGEVSDVPYNNMLAIQSQCQQYIDDVIAYLYFGYEDNPEVIYSGVTYAPFNERFQDEVSGMTATLTVQVPQPINNCVTPIGPFVPPPPTGSFVLDASSTTVFTFNPDIFDGPQPFPNVILDTYNAMRPGQANFYTITQDGTWTFVMTGTGVRLTDTSNFPTGFNLNSQNGGISLEADVTNWPTNPAVGVNFDFELKWTDIPLQISNGFVAFQTKDELPTEDSGQTFIGTNVKGYYTA